MIGDPAAGAKNLKSQPGEPLVLVNARLVPSVSTVERVMKLARAGRPGVVGQNGSTAVAILPPEAPPFPVDARPAEVVGYFSLQSLPPLEAELPLIQYPHDVVRHHLVVLAENLEFRLKSGEYREIADGVFAADDAKLGQYCVSETHKGPILLEAGSSIGPYCFLRGPAYLGRKRASHRAIGDQRRRQRRPHDEDRRRGRRFHHRAVHQQTASRLPRPQLPRKLGQPRRRHLQQRPEEHLRPR